MIRDGKLAEPAEKHRICIDDINLEKVDAPEVPTKPEGENMLLNPDFAEGDKNWVNTVENDTQEILAPSLIIVKNGKVIHFDNETAINIGTITPEDYWSIDKTSLKLNNFKTLFQDYLKN